MLTPYTLVQFLAVLCKKKKEKGMINWSIEVDCFGYDT